MQVAKRITFCIRLIASNASNHVAGWKGIWDISREQQRISQTWG